MVGLKAFSVTVASVAKLNLSPLALCQCAVTPNAGPAIGKIFMNCELNVGIEKTNFGLEKSLTPEKMGH